jgi:hypothetical protein
MKYPGLYSITLVTHCQFRCTIRWLVVLALGYQVHNRVLRVLLLNFSHSRITHEANYHLLQLFEAALRRLSVARCAQRSTQHSVAQPFSLDNHPKFVDDKTT